ncbi:MULTISPECIES: alpha-amylase family glycosyl hydrolase [unclassified Thermotoga]|uniref:alpha-amylase family glycosyl hydrolase n=1 Tax=unclassified Thermotoga TaxID=2631113 RepID=UPI000543B647|nr:MULTISPECIES: alpha-amylase family glycosyl hydrolase [unclassified Thermotoga]KHC95893.1 Alpha-amylase [Thermotoga sp. TBGT1765]KHC96910.1 Alpha-amylase [Thermotoga sp. Xyl54]
MKKTFLLLALVFLLFLTSCFQTSMSQSLVSSNPHSNSTNTGDSASNLSINEVKYPVVYEIFIRSFYDSDGDGVGDINGVSQKVDYLRKLGIDAVWFMPFNEAVSYHGYDITDYYNVEKDYGTMEDLENMIQVLHENGIKVIMDLVINHTSDEHPWFKDAVENTTSSPYWDYYIMSLEDHSGQDHWHWKVNSRGQKVWYFGLFGYTMPDLNHDNTSVKDEVKKIVDFWLSKGVDGFRIDAAKHIYGWSWDDGVVASAEYFEWFKDYVLSKKPDAIIVGEVFSGNVSDLSIYPISVFNFALMYGIRNNLEGIDGLLENNWVENSFPFLENHDLNRFFSHVQDVYNLFDASGYELIKKRVALWYFLLFTLKGSPVIYYGGEIGTRGFKWYGPIYDEPLREPMQWYAEGSGEGQTFWTREIYDARGVTYGNANVDGCVYDDPFDGFSVEEQENDPKSLLNFFKFMLGFRKEHESILNGDQRIFRDWKNLIAFYRYSSNEELLVVVNPDPVWPNSFSFEKDMTMILEVDFENFTWSEKNNFFSSGENFEVSPMKGYIFKSEEVRK